MKIDGSLLDLVPTVLPETGDDVKAAVQLFAEYGPAGITRLDPQDLFDASPQNGAAFRP